MGIKNLLIGLRSITDDVHIQEYRGKTVAIDGYTWVHKGVFACAEDLANGKHSERWIAFCEKRLALLQSYDVKPYFVFDGCNLPAKQVTEIERQQRRTEALQRARDAKARGDSVAAQGQFSAAVDVSPAMVSIWLERLRRRNIPFIVAPYEADAQLAYLAINGHVHAVLTEDSDLIPYGVERVLFKMDKEGKGKQICAQDLTRCEEMSFAHWTEEMVLTMCILAGCDYLPSPPGMALKRAHEFVAKFPAGTPKFLDKMLSKLQLEKGVSKQYADDFRKAKMTFSYQRVFDPVQRKMVHLRPLPALLEQVLKENPAGLDFLGPAFTDEVACAIADGFIDPTTLQPYPPPPDSPSAGGPPRAVFHAQTAAIGSSSGMGTGTGWGTAPAANAHGSDVPNPNAYRSIGAGGHGKGPLPPAKSPVVPSHRNGQRNIFSMLQPCKADRSGAKQGASMPQGQGAGSAQQSHRSTATVPPVLADTRSFFGLKAASSSSSSSAACPPHSTAAAEVLEIEDDSAPGEPAQSTSSGILQAQPAVPALEVVRSKHFAVPSRPPVQLQAPTSVSMAATRPVDQLVMDEGADRQVLVLGERSSQPTGEDPDTELVADDDAGGRLLGYAYGRTAGGSSAQPSTTADRQIGPQLLQHKYNSRHAGGSRLPASVSAGMSSAAMSARHGAASIHAKVSGAASVLVGPLQSPPPGRAQGAKPGIENSEPRAGAAARPSVVDRLSAFAFSTGPPTFSTPAPVLAGPVDWEALSKKASEKKAAAAPVPVSAVSSRSTRQRGPSASVIPGTVGPAGMLTGQMGKSKAMHPGQEGEAMAETVQVAGKKRGGVFRQSPVQGRSPATRSASKRMRGGQEYGKLTGEQLDTSAIRPLTDLEEEIEEQEAGSSEQVFGVMPVTAHSRMYGVVEADAGMAGGAGGPLQVQVPLGGVLHGLNPNILRQTAEPAAPAARPFRSKGVLDSYRFESRSSPPPPVMPESIMARFHKPATDRLSSPGLAHRPNSKVQLGSGMVNFNVSGL